MNPDIETGQLVITELAAIRQRLIDLEESAKSHIRADKLIRESEELYRMLIETSPDPIIMSDPEGNILAANTQTAKTYGISHVEAFLREVKTIADLLTDDGKASRAADCRFPFGAGVSQKKEFIMRLKNGKSIFVEINSSAVQTATGEPRAFISVIRDISDKKQAEEKKAKQEVEYRQRQKDESLGRMAGAIAHNFNNLLGAVLGNLELAMLHLPHESDAGRNLSAAMKAANRAAEVSSLMLTYLGQTHSRHETLDLSDVCSRTIDRLRKAAPREIQLEVDLEFPGPAVEADAHQIHQVLTNLATNAWEALDEAGGEIHLTVKTVHLDDIPLKHRFPLCWEPRDHLYACMAVADTGCGITDADVEMLFDPFYTSKFTGRGLGLPVVLGIVKEHGGVVTVESTPGVGTILQVFLPLSAQTIPLPELQAVRVPQPTAGGMILLIEDQKIVRKIARAMLAHLGFSVVEAKDGVESMEVLRKYRREIRCVLCDLSMPRMDGWETLASLRKIAPRLPFILASGYDQSQVLSGNHPEWPQAFLGKPYTLRSLSDAISQALEHQQANAGNGSSSLVY